MEGRASVFLSSPRTSGSPSEAKILAPVFVAKQNSLRTVSFSQLAPLTLYFHTSRRSSLQASLLVVYADFIAEMS